MPALGRLIVFAKAPRLGTVKTRLAAGLGPNGAMVALAVHRRLAERTVRAAREVCGEEVWLGPTLPAGMQLSAMPAEFRDPLVADVSLVVATTPADAVPEVRTWLGDDLDVRPQRGDDLGVRMANAMTDAFLEGAKRVVIVGSDVPRLTSTHLRMALVGLAHADVALGPSVDGGYWLVGARDRVPPIFAGISWSSATVFDETSERLGRARLSVTPLETLHDVDTAADLALYPELME